LNNTNERYGSPSFVDFMRCVCCRFIVTCSVKERNRRFTADSACYGRIFQSFWKYVLKLF